MLLLTSRRNSYTWVSILEIYTLMYAYIWQLRLLNRRQRTYALSGWDQLLGAVVPPRRNAGLKILMLTTTRVVHSGWTTKNYATIIDTEIRNANLWGWFRQK